MLPAPIPPDETERMRALHDLHILDTVDEERFDRVTRIAARLFDVPFALVSLVDGDRQWFKSKQGTSVCETSRDISFCGHAVYARDVLVVNDARLDERFSDNPQVVGGMGVRFYAGHPLHSPSGQVLGTLCVIDRRPREFPLADRAMLADLAALVERELGLLVESTHDPMTRLYNRRGLDEVAQHVLELCARSNAKAALVSIDLDGFKAVNDQQGHEAGDRVLQWFGSNLLKHFRKSDVVARLGGDEFCVLAPLMTEGEVHRCMKRLEGAFRISPLAQRHPALGWSCGVVEFDCDGEVDLDALLDEADRRMYAARQQSRASRAGAT